MLYNGKLYISQEYIRSYQVLYRDFIKTLGTYQSFVFFPQTPETLSRVVVEARMMGVTVITNKLIGATKEDWFSMKGKELIDYMRRKKEDIVGLVLDALGEKNDFSNRP